MVIYIDLTAEHLLRQSRRYVDDLLAHLLFGISLGSLDFSLSLTDNTLGFLTRLIKKNFITVLRLLDGFLYDTV